MGIIAKQLKSLVRKPSEGVRYIADKGSLTEVHVMIAGPGETLDTNTITESFWRQRWCEQPIVAHQSHHCSAIGPPGSQIALRTREESST